MGKARSHFPQFGQAAGPYQLLLQTIFFRVRTYHAVDNPPGQIKGDRNDGGAADEADQKNEIACISQVLECVPDFLAHHH